jgi:hypothetical protein
MSDPDGWGLEDIVWATAMLHDHGVCAGRSVLRTASR